jgi:hypothetical protein
MEEVIKDADSFVKVTITKSSPQKFEAKVVKLLAGNPTPDKIKVVGFSLLKLTSTNSGSNEVTLQFNPKLGYYLFLKATKRKGEYLIATPETGWAKIIPKGVNATFRHSYHQALVPEAVYEMCMTAIFNRLHNKSTDTREVLRFIREQLAKKPALFGKAKGDENVAKDFFYQHAALESFQYFGAEEMISSLDPFLSADDFHVQVSATRALYCSSSQGSKQRNMDCILSDRVGFAKVMAVWNLYRWDAREYAPQLHDYLRDGKDEETGFGGNVMDPRIGTSFPSSVKHAINGLLKKWNEPHSE